MQRLNTNTIKSALVYPLRTILSPKLNETVENKGMKSDGLKHLNPLTISDEPLNSLKAPTRFLIHTKDEVKVILFDQVMCCVADSNYTKIHLSDGSKVMVSKTLKDVASILYQSQFFRIHASSLINLNFIKRILKADGCTVELMNNIMLEVSRSRRDELMNKMGSL